MTSATEGYTLHGDSLLSKWGFGDGDGLDDWWWDRFDQELPVDKHELLRALVRAHLVPAIEASGHTITVFDIQTIHNPIRADFLDGDEINHRGDSTFDPAVEVTVTLEQIWDGIAQIQRAEVRGLTVPAPPTDN